MYDLQDVASNNELTYEQAFQQMKEYLDNDNLTAAIKFGGQLTKQYPNDDASWLCLAAAQMDLEQFEDAELSLLEAIAIAPEKTLYYNQLGHVLAEQGHYKQSTARFKAAVELEPGNVAYRFDLAETICQGSCNQEDYQGLAAGIAEMEACLELDPENAEYRNRLGHWQLCTSNAHWQSHPDNDQVYPTSKEDMDKTLAILDQVENLGVTDEEVLARLQTMRDMVARLSKRRFSGRYLPMVPYVLLVAMQLAMGTPGAVVFLAFPGLYFWACREPQYVTNARLFAGKYTNLFDRIQMGLTNIRSGFYVIGSFTDVIRIKFLFWLGFLMVEMCITAALLPLACLVYGYRNHFANRYVPAT